MKVYGLGERPPRWMDRVRSMFGEEYESGIRQDPKRPFRWFREFDLVYHAESHRVEPRVFLAEAQRHLTIAQEEFGIRMPKTEWHISPVRFSKGESTPSGQTLYIATEHITGLNMNYAARRWPEKDFGLGGLARAVTAYCDWVEETGQELGLCDLYPLRNYVYGTTSTDNTERLYFVDNEPLFGHPTVVQGEFYDFSERRQDWDDQREAIHRMAQAYPDVQSGP